MHRSIDEEKFAAAIKDHSRISLLNDVRFNIAELLNNLKPLDPPDFVYSEHIFEKFEKKIVFCVCIREISLKLQTANLIAGFFSW